MIQEEIIINRQVFQAVALKFEPESDEVPSVLVKGQGKQAEEIVKRAEEAGIAVEQIPPLAAALMRLEEGDCIPPSLYLAVAEVIAYIMELEEREASRKPWR